MTRSAEKARWEGQRWGSFPSLQRLLLHLLFLLCVVPSSLVLVPTSPAARDAAERGAPSLAELGPFLQFSTVTRWGVLFAEGACPYVAPGSTGCAISPAGGPGCVGNTCLSPQQPAECVIWCGTAGRAPYGGTPCTSVMGQRCQKCQGSTLSFPMYCTPPVCSQSAPANGGVGTCGSVNGNSYCNIVCNAGYSATGGSYPASPTQRFCASGGVWGSAAPTCVKTSCDGGNVANSIVSSGSCKFAVIPNGGSCSFVCGTGYIARNTGSLTAVSARVCSSGVFSHTQYCMAKRCYSHALPALEASKNSLGVTITGTGGVGGCNDVASGSYCLMTCPSGYTITPTQPLCTLGAWSSTVVTCQAKDCPTTAPKDGTLGSCSATIQSGTACNFVCNAPGNRGSLYNFHLEQAGGVTGLHCFLGTIYKAGTTQLGVQTCEPDDCELLAPRNGGFGTCLSNPTPSNMLPTSPTLAATRATMDTRSSARPTSVTMGS